MLYYKRRFDRWLFVTRFLTAKFAPLLVRKTARIIDPNIRKTVRMNWCRMVLSIPTMIYRHGRPCVTWVRSLNVISVQVIRICCSAARRFMLMLLVYPRIMLNCIICWLTLIACLNLCPLLSANSLAIILLFSILMALRLIQLYMSTCVRRINPNQSPPRYPLPRRLRLRQLFPL